MTHDEAISVLRSMLDVSTGYDDPFHPHWRDAIKMAVVAMRRKDPVRLVEALGRFEFESGRRRGDPIWENDKLRREFCLEGARRLVDFLQAFGRDPNLDIRGAALRIKSAKERTST